MVVEPIVQLPVLYKCPGQYFAGVEMVVEAMELFSFPASMVYAYIVDGGEGEHEGERAVVCVVWQVLPRPSLY